VVAGAAGAITGGGTGAGTVNSVKNQCGTGTKGGFVLISQGVAPAYSLSAFAFNQQIFPDRNSVGSNTADVQPASYQAKPDWAAWPNCVGGGMGQGQGINVNSPRKLKDLTDGASQTLMLGEINQDTRQNGTGNMVYRDHAFSGGGEMTRALGGSNVLNNQLVFPDQNYDVMGWSNVRGYWGGPHPGGATVVMADGSVLSVPHGTDLTSFVGIADQIINDSSKLGR
jgi:prepilin-type processing-associated H-X9-DG protein